MAKRTVSVGLNLDAGQYKTEATVVEAKTDGMSDSVEKLDRDITKIPADAAKAAAALKLLGGDADGLRGKLSDIGPEATNSLELIDKQLDETSAKLKQAAADFNQTGNADSFSLWQKFTQDKGELEKLKKDLTAALDDGAKDAETAIADAVNAGSKSGGDRGGKSIVAGIIGHLPVLGKSISSAIEDGAEGAEGALAKAIASAPPQLQAALGIGLAAAIAAAAAPIGAAVNGAILGGIGLGGIGLGIAGQFHTPAVKTAYEQLGHNLQAELEDATTGFENRLTVSAGILNTAFRQIEPGLESTMNRLDLAVEPLTQGLSHFIINLMPGLDEGLQAALPIILQLARSLPALGTSLSKMFSDMAAGGKGAGEGVQYLLVGIETLVEDSGEAIEVLSKIFQFMVAFADDASAVMQKAFGWIPVLGDWIKSNHSMFEDLRNGQDASALSTDNLSDSLQGLTGSLQQTTPALQALDQATLEWNNDALDAKGASLSFQDSVDSMTSALKQSKKGLDDNSAAGRQAEEAYIAGAKAAQSHADAVYKSTGSAVAAAGAYQKDIDKLNSAAKQAGATKQQLQGLNGQLDDAVKVRSGTTTITVRVLGNGATMINNRGTYSIVGQLPKFNRWGGIYQHAADGLLSQADTFSPTNPGRYMIAEPQTGGEAFVPRNGDYARSTAILDQAARWYGGRFTPAQGRGATVNIYTTQMDERRLAAVVDRRLSAAGLK